MCQCLHTEVLRVVQWRKEFLSTNDAGAIRHPYAKMNFSPYVAPIIKLIQRKHRYKLPEKMTKEKIFVTLD